MGTRPRVLLVDDDPDELELLSAVLSPLDFETAKAGCAHDALRLLEQAPFSAAVVDLLMPRVNGFETAALLRGHPNGRDMRIVILSGYDENGAHSLPGWDAVQGRVEYLEKPFAGDVLRRRLLRAYSPA